MQKTYVLPVTGKVAGVSGALSGTLLHLAAGAVQLRGVPRGGVNESPLA
jgi:hypothetical protein